MFKTLTLESIFEYIRKKIYVRILILKFHPGMKCLNVFFSFLHPGMKFHPCLFYRDEFILGWNFISAKACKQWETFHHRQEWFHPGTSFILGWNFTCKHPLSKRCSGNMQQIYRRAPMKKCAFNKVALQLYWNQTSAWVFSCKSVAYFQNTFY